MGVMFAGSDVPSRRRPARHDGPVPTQPSDDELELIRQSGVALRVGRLSLSAGTVSFRVKASMARVARALGVDRFFNDAAPTEISPSPTPFALHNALPICPLAQKAGNRQGAKNAK